MDTNSIQFTSAIRTPTEKATVTSISVRAVVKVALFKNRQAKKNRLTILVCEIKFLYNSTVRELFPQTCLAARSSDC